MSADDDRGQDYDGQVQVSEDRVALGDEDHDAELGDQGTGDEHHADEDGIAQGALLALLGLVVLAEARDAREGEADDRAEDGDEDDDYVHDGQPVVAEALEQGDKLAAEIFDTVGTYLGRGLSVLIDILNPQMIVIGSIYGRQKSVLDKKMMETLEKEALPVSRKACRIVPASLGELIGDYAAVSVGIKAYQDLYRNAERFSLKMTSTVS